jgi:hypothetical protein
MKGTCFVFTHSCSKNDILLTAVQCPVPEEIADGRVIFSSLTYNSVARYECRYGFKISGLATRRCGANKEWEGPQSKCEEIDCRHPGPIPNGYVEGIRTTPGSDVFFKCYEGMTFVGLNSSTCLDTGLWSNPPPLCMAPCIIPDVENGRVNGVAPGVKVPHGEGIQVDCKPQFELTYNSSGAKCHNGSWTQMPLCVPGETISCNSYNKFVIERNCSKYGMKSLVDRISHKETTRHI